jgi:hypothetical protein
MLKLKFIIPAMLIVAAGCSQKVQNNASQNSTKTPSDSLYVALSIKEVIKAGSPVSLKFVVHNNKNTGKSFCKWHTPFEPLMSKYLDIRDENGNEAAYKGPMAKRVMPPSVDSYLVVNPTDSIQASVNLLKGYALETGKKYTVSYNSSGMSGLKATNSVSFKYEN